MSREKSAGVQPRDFQPRRGSGAAAPHPCPPPLDVGATSRVVRRMTRLARRHHVLHVTRAVYERRPVAARETPEFLERTRCVVTDQALAVGAAVETQSAAMVVALERDRAAALPPARSVRARPRLRLQPIHQALALVRRRTVRAATLDRALGRSAAPDADDGHAVDHPDGSCTRRNVSGFVKRLRRLSAVYLQPTHATVWDSSKSGS